jgi:uncharacterized protein DUF2505
MRFEHVNSYDAPAGAVYAMLVDRGFREQVCLAIKSPQSSVEVSGDVTVVIDQTQVVRNVPAFAAKLVGDRIDIHQVERWTSPTTADIEITIPGKPGQLRGTVTLTPSAGGGTDHVVAGDLKIGVPLVGGKLEGLIAGLLGKAMDKELEVGRSWLA